MSSKARIVVGFVIFIGILFGAVYPTRTYLRQQRELSAAEEKLALFKAQNGRLESEAKRLESDAEIERIARARFNLVKPGEEAYAVVQVPAPPGTPAAAPAPSAGTKPRSSPPDTVLNWMVSTLQRVF